MLCRKMYALPLLACYIVRHGAAHRMHVYIHVPYAKGFYIALYCVKFFKSFKILQIVRFALRLNEVSPHRHQKATEKTRGEPIQAQPSVCLPRIYLAKIVLTLCTLCI